MIRVLSIATLFPNHAKPGFGLFVARQFDALARRGDIDLTVINPIPALPFAGRRSCDESRAYTVHHVPFFTIPRFGARWKPRLIALAVLPLARLLHAERPFDLVDAQFFYPDGPAAAMIASALGLRLSIKARGSDIHYWGNLPFARRQMLAAADQSAGLLAVSQALRRDMAALGMDEAKITVHYTGLDHGRFLPLPRAEARATCAAIVPSDGPLLVSAGNLIPIKGQALVIEALAAIPGARLVLAGSGPDEAQLRALAANLGLAGRVHFPGSLTPDALAVLLAAADALVLPSEREGLANVWIEALACGTPLVITDVGGAREVVTSPTAGRLVTRDPEAIARAVHDLLANPPSQAEVADNAARFSWEANAAQLAAHYRGIAGQPRSRASRS